MNKLIFLYVTTNVSDLNTIFVKDFKASFDQEAGKYLKHYCWDCKLFAAKIFFFWVIQDTVKTMSCCSSDNFTHSQKKWRNYFRIIWNYAIFLSTSLVQTSSDYTWNSNQFFSESSWSIQNKKLPQDFGLRL